MAAPPTPKKPLALDNDEEYPVSVDSLIEANHHDQFDEPYWQVYRALGELFARKFPIGGEDIPDKHALLVQMIAAWKAYSDGDYKPELTVQEKSIAKRRLQAYRYVKQHKQIEDLLTLHGRGQHRLTINNQQWCYEALDGNHRLIACHFCNVSNVTVQLKSR